MGNGLMNILTCSNGAAYADFDNDGDMDIIVNNSEDPSFIYKNNAIEIGSGNYLTVQTYWSKEESCWDWN